MQKIYIFDLDDTLWNGLRLYPDVKRILSSLRKANCYIYIASFNLFADKILTLLDIHKYFHGGSYGRNVSKLGMINQIKNYHNSVYNIQNNQVEIYFFDDLPSNIVEVRRDKSIIPVHILYGLTARHIKNAKQLSGKISNV